MPKRTPPLTDKACQGLRAEPGQRATIRDGRCPGLLLVVSGDTGRKVWQHDFRFGGKRRKRAIGVYGPAPLLTLAEARKEVQARTRKIDQGEDPDEERRAARDGGDPDLSFRALADTVLEKKAEETRPKTQKLRRDAADRYLIPEWGDRPAAEVSTWDVTALVRKIKRDGKGVTANRVLSLIHLLFAEGKREAFGGDPDFLNNPAATVRPPHDEKGRRRFLDRGEVAAVWNALEGQGALVEGAGKLALLTAQRIGAVLRMRWDRIKVDEERGVFCWTTPAEDHKGGRTVHTPLSGEALAVVERLRELATDTTWVFPSRDGAKLPHLSNLSSSTLARVRRDSGLEENWVWHDFRRTFTTWAESSPDHPWTPGLGVDPAVVGAVLTHKDASLLESRYRGDPAWSLYPEKADALERWGEWVRAAVEDCAQEPRGEVAASA